MTDEQFNDMSEKLNAILELLTTAKVNAEKKENAPKTSVNTPRSDSKTLTGTVKWAELKEGKRGQFLVFKLFDSEDGIVACNIWDIDSVGTCADGMKVEVSGYYSTWGQYSNFTVKSLKILSAPEGETQPTSSNTPEDDEDEVPF